MRDNKQSEVLQSFFYKTGRNTKLQQQIEDGKSEALERAGNRSRKVQKMRAKYLILKNISYFPY
jgi:hypothetical protein